MGSSWDPSARTWRLALADIGSTIQYKLRVWGSKRRMPEAPLDSEFSYRKKAGLSFLLLGPSSWM